MSLPQQKYPNNSRTISGASNDVRENDVILLCNTASGVVGLTLQAIPDNYWSSQYKLYVVDAGANAGTNNITINAPSGQTINGASSFVISTNSASVIIRIVANGTYICQYSVIGGGGISQAYQTIQEEASPLTQRSTLNFTGSSITATDDGANSRTNVNVQAYNTIQEEGISATQRDTINFSGSLVSVLDDSANSKTIIDVNTKSFFSLLAINTSFTPPSGIIPFASTTLPTGSGTMGLANRGQTISRYIQVSSDIYVTSVSVVSASAPAVYDITFSANHNLSSNVNVRLVQINGATDLNSLFTYTAGVPTTNEFSIQSATSIRVQIANAATTYTGGGRLIVTATATALNFVNTPPDCSFGSLNQLSGTFTINQSGLYLVEGSIVVKPNDLSAPEVYWQTGPDTGSFAIGFCTNNQTDVYAGNYMAVIPNIHNQVNVSASTIVSVGSSASIRLVVLNWTDRNYDGTLYAATDIIRFGITKLI